MLLLAQRCVRLIRAQRAFTALFVKSAAAIFATTGVAKIIAAFSHAPLVAFMPDPVFGVEERYVFMGVGLLEFVVCAVCVGRSSSLLSVKLIAWMATNFLMYHVTLFLMGWQQPCACLGYLTSAFHIAPRVGDFLVRMLVAYLLIGSYLVLLISWRAPYARSVPRSEAD